MVTGHLREKRGIYHIVLNYVDENGKRKTPSKTTGLPVKGNKKRAEAMLREACKIKEAELEQRKEERQEQERSSLRNLPFTALFSYPNHVLIAFKYGHIHLGNLSYLVTEASGVHIMLERILRQYNVSDIDLISQGTCNPCIYDSAYMVPVH